MRTKRYAMSMVAALMLAGAAMSGSTVTASAAYYRGGAGFNTYGWNQCGDTLVYTHISAHIEWTLNTVVLHNGVYWALTPVSAMVMINDPGLVRDACAPYLMPRVFDLKNSSGVIVASNQTATETLSYSGCLAYTYDPNYYTMANGCHHGAYYFKYTHPAGYIYYGASVLPFDGGGWAGNTGWVSLGG